MQKQTFKALLDVFALGSLKTPAMWFKMGWARQESLTLRVGKHTTYCFLRRLCLRFYACGNLPAFAHYFFFKEQIGDRGKT
jgi:hypothetical protein